MLKSSRSIPIIIYLKNKEKNDFQIIILTNLITVKFTNLQRSRDKLIAYIDKTNISGI